MDMINWEAVGAVGEVVGAFAVVFTLVYVSKQIRAGNRALQTTIRDSAFHQLQEWNNTIMKDERLGLLFQRGARDMESLDEWERARVGYVMFSFFKIFENIYLHYVDGSVSPGVWERNNPIFFTYARQPGCKYYWNRRRDTFDPRFREVVDNIETTPLAPGHEVSNLPM
jgi:hypothetical protein